MNFKPHGGFRKARLRTGSKLKNAVSVNWITFNSLAVIWFITVFPTLFFLAAADSPLDPLVRGVLYVLVLAITGLFAYLDVAKFDVAERKPRTFLKVELFKTYFSRIFWLFIYLPSIVLVLMYYFLPLILSTANLNKLAPIFAPSLIVYLYVLFGATFYLLGMVGNVGRQPKVLKARSKAYFRVLSESLSNPSIEKRGKFSGYLRAFLERRSESIEEKKKLNRIFEDGMNNLNGLLWYLYGFEVCDSSKYCDYIRLVIWTEDSTELERIRKKLDVLAYYLRQKIKVSDILWATRQLINKQQFVSKEDLIQELDFKTGINKWYFRHKEGVALALLTIPIIVSVVALFFSIPI